MPAKNAHASALGRLALGKKKTLTESERDRRRKSLAKVRRSSGVTRVPLPSQCSRTPPCLGAVQTQLEAAWTALCKQDWGSATQNVFDLRASVTKLVESVRGHSATEKSSDAGRKNT